VESGAIAESDLMEKPDGGPALTLNGGKVALDFAPWEIKTLRIDDPR
jgi:hypothetical protein